ncbi:MAG: hypothetical protein M5U28_22885 [Sandaracinaceae bacterium]|nr:hypothetical protein [Sandaracinaceae bacterium]
MELARAPLPRPRRLRQRRGLRRRGGGVGRHEQARPLEPGPGRERRLAARHLAEELERALRHARSLRRTRAHPGHAGPLLALRLTEQLAGQLHRCAGIALERGAQPSERRAPVHEHHVRIEAPHDLRGRRGRRRGRDGQRGQRRVAGGERGGERAHHDPKRHGQEHGGRAYGRPRGRPTNRSIRARTGRELLAGSPRPVDLAALRVVHAR